MASMSTWGHFSGSGSSACVWTARPAAGATRPSGSGAVSAWAPSDHGPGEPPFRVSVTPVSDPPPSTLPASSRGVAWIFFGSRTIYSNHRTKVY